MRLRMSLLLCFAKSVSFVMLTLMFTLMLMLQCKPSFRRRSNQLMRRLWKRSTWSQSAAPQPNAISGDSTQRETLEYCLAYGTRVRCPRGSQNCAVLSILCPFTGNGTFLCVNDVVVDLSCRKDTLKVFFLKVNINKCIINTILTSSQKHQTEFVLK